MKFSQQIVVTATDEDALLNLIRDGAAKPPDGMAGLRLLRLRGQSHRYLIQVDFDSRESAEASNQRPETQAWARRLAEMTDGEPEYADFNVVFDQRR